ncbi:MAG: MATE family efflux transporter [Devosiaceae bacterium]|nr:MATE family efflux transporter [Devosiaceae bacterium]
MPAKTLVAQTWAEEVRATFVLAWPLVVAQLAGIALNATDVIMMGWLGPSELAAGALANSIFFTLFVGGLGLVTAASPLIAQALGARKGKSVRRTVRQGLWLAIAFTVGMTPIVLNLSPVFLALGQDPAVIALTKEYLSTAVWMVFPGLGIVVMRSLVSARGDAQVVLWVTVVGIFVNAFGNYALMFGNWGAPRLELVGAGITTTVVNFVMFFIILGFVLLHRRYRRYHVLVRFFKPDWPKFFELLRLGTPISLTIISEVSLFGLASILMGNLGTTELAAHAVALQLASIAFMIPLGLSQATTVRVGLAYGAGNLKAIGRAGWVSMGVGMGFMIASCSVFLLFPDFLVGLYLDKTIAENQAALLLAASFLVIAAAFQLVDGAQVIMLASLRGLSDTKIPMIIAFVGYWGVGMGTAYIAGFVWEWRGMGVWFGMATGLTFVAILLTLRFAMREKLGLLKANR